MNLCLLQPIYGYGKAIIYIQDNPNAASGDSIVKIMEIFNESTSLCLMKFGYLKRVINGVNIARICLKQVLLNDGPKIQIFRNLGELLLTIDSICHNHFRLSNVGLAVNNYFNRPLPPIKGNIPKQQVEITKLSKEDKKRRLDSLSQRIKSDNLLYLDEIPEELYDDPVFAASVCALSGRPIRFPLIIQIPKKTPMLVDFKAFKACKGNIPGLSCNTAWAKRYSQIDKKRLSRIDSRLITIRRRLSRRERGSEVSEGLISYGIAKGMEYPLRGISWLSGKFWDQCLMLESIVLEDRINNGITKFGIAAEMGATMSGTVATASDLALFTLSGIYFGVNSLFGGTEEPIKRLLRTGVLGTIGINAVTKNLEAAP